MSTEKDWFLSAESNFEAASALAERCRPSSVSRAYYAAYSASHAIVMARGETPPARGNWPHEGLGELVRTVLARGQDEWKRQELLQYKQAINELQSLRILADYEPASVFEGQDWISSARRVLALARRCLT